MPRLSVRLRMRSRRVPLSVNDVVHLYGVALDCYAALSFEIHVVEHLRLHVFGCDCVGVFEQTVGQGRFAVVDMGYYAEITDIFHL